MYPIYKKAITVFLSLLHLSALVLPIAFTWHATISVLNQITLLTLVSIASYQTLSIPKTLVLTTPRGKSRKKELVLKMPLEKRPPPHNLLQ